MKEKRSRDMLALVTTDKKWVGGGKTQVFLAENDQQALMLCKEVARALQGEVVALSNGIYLILEV